MYCNVTFFYANPSLEEMIIYIFGKQFRTKGAIFAFGRIFQSQSI